MIDILNLNPYFKLFAFYGYDAVYAILERIRQPFQKKKCLFLNSKIKKSNQ